MKQVTRNIDPDSASDLLVRGARACITFACSNGPQALPVMLVWLDKRYLVGIPEGATQQPSTGQEGVLLVDEGVHFFDLRALYIRGSLQPAGAPENAPAGHTWFEIVPLKRVAWDYGMLREVDDEH